MTLYRVCGHVDDGYTTRDEYVVHYIFARNKSTARQMFIDKYNDGWGGFAYDVVATEVPTGSEMILV